MLYATTHEAEWREPANERPHHVETKISIPAASVAVVEEDGSIPQYADTYSYMIYSGRTAPDVPCPVRRGDSVRRVMIVDAETWERLSKE